MRPKTEPKLNIRYPPSMMKRADRPDHYDTAQGSAKSLARSDMRRACSACGTVVARADCHRNRFGEYICKTCMGIGVRNTQRARWLHGVRRFFRRSSWGLVGTLMFLMLLTAFYLFAQ